MLHNQTNSFPYKTVDIFLHCFAILCYTQSNIEKLLPWQENEVGQFKHVPDVIRQGTISAAVLWLKKNQRRLYNQAR